MTIVLSNNYSDRLYSQEKDCVRELYKAIEEKSIVGQKIIDLRDRLADIHGRICREEEEKKNVKTSA